MNLPRHHNNKAIVVALALALTACGKSPEQHFIQAQERVQKADYKAAAIELKTVLQEQPDNREARLMLGEVSLKNGAFSDAEKELSRARSLGIPDDRVLPSLAKAYVKIGDPQKALDLGIPTTGLTPQSLAALHTMRAEAQLSLGKRAEAELSVGVATQVDPKQPELLLTRAKLALLDKHKDQAGQLLDEALLQDPKFAEAFFLKAALLESDNKPDDAAKIYRQILANDPSQFRAHLAIGSQQLKKGDTDAADQSFQAAEKIAGKTPLVMYSRGTLELQRGKLDAASSAFLEVLRVAPDHLPTLLAYAMTNHGQGNYEQSINYSGKVLGVVPGNLVATKILVSSKLKRGDVQGALETLNAHMAKYQSDSRLLALAGDAYLQAGDYIKAMSFLDKAAKLEPGNAEIKTRQAAGHLAMGNSSEALIDLEAAVSLSEKPGQADLALVTLHLKSKQYDQALLAINQLEKKLPNNPVTHNLRAAALLGKQDQDGARKALLQALAIDPKFFPAAANLARLDMQDKKPEAARKRFESILAQDKNNVKAMLALASLAAAEKNEKDYVGWLQKAAKADPKSIDSSAGLVQYYLSKKEKQKALSLAREATNANPDSFQAMSLLGTTQLAIGDKPAAIETFNRMTLKSPQSPEAYLRLALAQIADKKLAAARDSLNKSIQLKPDFLKAQDALIRLEMAEKHPAAALQIARQIQHQQPKSPFGFEHEADILLSQKNFPQAIKAYEQALSKEANASRLIKLHSTLHLSGNDNSAEQRLNNWLQQNPKDTAVRAYAAEFYMLNQRDQDAIVQYEMILKMDQMNAVALNNLANLYQRTKDSRALNIAEQAYKLAPDNPGVQDTLGWILVEKGVDARGLELLRKAASNVPKVAVIRYHYGVALARSGNKLQAKKELEAAIATGQKFPELEDAKAMLRIL